MDAGDYRPIRDPTRVCLVPMCGHNNLEKPEMAFVPVRKELKDNWCQILQRNCPRRPLYCCEDHLNLEEDLENYHQFLSGSKPKLKLNVTLKNIQRETHGIPDSIVTVNAGVQCQITTKNKYVMVKPDTKDKFTNFRSRTRNPEAGPSPQSFTQTSTIDTMAEESPSLFGSSNFESSSSRTSPIFENTYQGRDHLLKNIQEDPKTYLGLPKTHWWIIDFLAKEFSSLPLYIILTLFQIKNNDSFIRISNEFQISRTTIRLTMQRNVSILATFFQNFIYLPSPIDIKKNLPLAFKIRYSNVQYIIDAFEIEIEKPSNPVKQSQTWSQYKHCNTLKYLIGCIPSGYIAFISKGFGGRISDKAITIRSGLMDILPPNAVIMADRGFKEIEALGRTKNIKLLKPPSVFSNKKLTKKEVIETKVIASLRVHVERVIRRVREFRMLKPHAVVNSKHVKYLDAIVIIACGLINLQNPLIKEFD